MIFENHLVPAELADYIDTIFYYSGFKPDHSIERVVPTGHAFILFELDGIPRHTYHSDTLESTGIYKNSWVSGMHKQYLSISAPQDSEMLAIQLKPEGCYPIFQCHVDQLSNRVVMADDVFNASFLDLRAQIIKEEEIAKKFAVIESWLLQNVRHENAPDSELITILRRLQLESLSQHAAIVSSYSKTQKHLISQFKKYFGLTPKVFQRIFRFNEILQRIHQKEIISWTDIAYQFAYTDQSHFIKEFKEFSGFNPTEFLKSDQQEQTNFFPLDKEG